MTAVATARAPALSTATKATATLEALLAPYARLAEDERLPARAYAVLRKAIRELRLLPGQLVLEQDVATALGISRTPIREAMVLLQAEGLGQLIPRHGFAVAPVSPHDLREVNQIMFGLEGVAVALAAEHASPEGMAALEASVVAQERALETDDVLAWAEADERFHHLIAELSGNARLAQLIVSFDNLQHRARLLTIRLRPRPVASTTEHRAVMTAIQRGDAEQARAFHQAHFQRGRAEILRVLEAMTPGIAGTEATPPAHEGAKQ
ncbi:MAG: GntR family transcriptional regulator [Chloroflexota bacterium]